MIMKSKIKKESLKLITGALTAIVNECKISVDESGWTIKTVDPAHVAMIDARIPKNVFEQYIFCPNAPKTELVNDRGINIESVVGESEENAFALDLDKLTNILKKGKDDDVISIEIDTENDVVDIGYPIDKNRNYGKVRVKRPSIEGMSCPKVPTLTLPNNYLIQSDMLYSAVKACGEYSDHLKIVGNGGIFVEAEGAESKFHVDYPKDLLLMSCDHEANASVFPFDYLDAYLSKMKGTDAIGVYVGNDLPMKLVTLQHDMSITYLLAPRIEND